MTTFPFHPKAKLDRETQALLTERYRTAPALSKDRPPTKAEVWEYVKHIYGSLVGKTDLIDYARNRWAWDYAAWVNFKGWDKHPDWIEGDDVVAAAVPERPMSGEMAPVNVQRLWQIARDAATR